MRSPEVLASCLVFQKGRSHGKIESVVWPRRSAAASFFPFNPAPRISLRREWAEKVKGKRVSARVEVTGRRKKAKSHRINTVLTFYLVEIKKKILVDVSYCIQRPKVSWNQRAPICLYSELAAPNGLGPV